MSGDIAVIGAGPAGLIAAALLAKTGLRPTLYACSPDADDPRTVALMQPAIRLLEHLEVWPGKLQSLAAPLRKLRLVDDTGAALAAPDLTFAAGELGQTEFGWNIPLRPLAEVLRNSVSSLGCEVVDESVASATPERGQVSLASDSGSRVFRVVLAADGSRSRLREAAGIAVNAWSYEQVAIATSFTHSAPHHDTSSEYHTPEGPFTTVPLPGRRSSLVWMLKPARAAAMAALTGDQLAAELQLMSHGDLGRIEAVGPRRSFAMTGLTARLYAHNRVMLIGEAAHGLPPIGAQGLNISLRDAALAAELIESAIAHGRDPGDPVLLRDYDARRRADVFPRQFAVDLINRSLLAGLLPVDATRSFALRMLGEFGPLRRAVMRQGLAPASLPSVMR